MAKFDPSYQWHSIKTEHFWIHYHQGLEKIAHKTANLAEKIHVKFSQKLRWKPFLRTDIVLVDSTDLANGYATPLPHNRTVLFVTRPEMDATLSHFDDWLENLLIHEYTHILSLDMTHSLAGVLKYVFGRLFFINGLQPQWIIEGLAVQQESLRGKGRNNSSYVDMIMRQEVLQNSFDSLTETSHFFHREWRFDNSYLYGGGFIDFLERQYGENSFTSIYEEQARNIWPFQVNDNTKNIYGRSAASLWKEWKQKQEKKYQKQLLKIKQKPLTPYRLLSNSGLFSGKGQFDPSGRSIYFIKDSIKEETQLVKYELPAHTRETGEKITREWFESLQPSSDQLLSISDVNRVNSISVGKGGQVFLSDLEIYQSYSRYHDIFLSSGSYAANYSLGLRRLSRGLRARYVDYNHPTKRIIFIQNRSDAYSLVTSDLSLNQKNTLIPDTDVQLAFSRLSPRGEEVAFSFKDRSGFSQVAVINLKTKLISGLTEGRFNHLQPNWHPNGDKVLFSSDETGVYNLYEYDLKKREVSQLSNVVGGLFHVDVSPDGKWITATSYGVSGFDQALMPYPTKAARKKNTKIKPVSPGYFTPKEQADELKSGEKPVKYTPWGSLWPSYWFFSPNFNFSTPGLIKYGVRTTVSDALDLNQYSLNLDHLHGLNRLSLRARYVYSGFWPDISIAYFNNRIFYADDDFVDFLRRNNVTSASRNLLQSLTLSLSFPFRYFQYSHNIGISYSLRERQTERYKNFRISRSFSGRLGAVFLRYGYQNTDFYPKSISPEDGRSISLSARMSHNIAEVIGYELRFNFFEYLPGFFSNHVFLLAIKTGAYLKNDSIHSLITPSSLGLRGQNDFSSYLYGAVFTIEYRLPLWQPDIGWYDYLPLLIRNVALHAFFDIGNLWDSSPDFSELRESAGGRLNIDLAGFNAFPLNLFLQYAHGFDELGEDRITWGISSDFLNLISSRESGQVNSKPERMTF